MTSPDMSFDGDWKMRDQTDCCCETNTATVTGTSTESVAMTTGSPCCCFCCSCMICCNFGKTFNLEKVDGMQRWEANVKEVGPNASHHLEVKEGELTFSQAVIDMNHDPTIKVWKMSR
mmetsp:Transcript_10959/g.19823  ORF Transcript_10959/g.19823 Transcript_10959/m.19823 type:complete len:118 (+) Transcript_10959:83-436(+)